MRCIFILFCLLETLVLAAQSSKVFTQDNFSKLRFTHRGGYGTDKPENNVNTILRSLKEGKNAIEIDVQFTKDNQLILFHDYSHERFLETEEVKEVKTYTYSKLKQYPLRNKADGKQYVALLEELVDSLVLLVPKLEVHNFLLELDFKPHGDQTKKAVNELVRIIDKHHFTLIDQLYEHFFISTFYPDVLKYLDQVKQQKGRPIVTAFAVNNAPDDHKFAANVAVFISPILLKKYGVTII